MGTGVTAEDLTSIITDKRRYIEAMMTVLNKDRQSVDFRFNRVQSLIWPEIRPGARLLVLKARQLGCTTIYIARFLADCLTVPGTVSVIASENEFATQRAMAKAQALEKSIPPEFKPVLHHKSTYELTWPAINSTMYITTARSNLLVRGDTVHNFLATEIARWPNPEDAMAAAEEAVPLGGFIAMESTPWGEGDYFHQLIQKSINSQSSYGFLFLPWWLDPEYRIPKGSELALASDRGNLEYTPEEENLAKLHSLDMDQVRWRRRKRADRGLSFYQEYVEDPDTCFLVSGDMVFDSAVLDELSRNCYPAPGTFESTRIWYPPTEKGVYLIAADPTVGVHDKAAATVWAVGASKLTHCATLWGLYEPSVLAMKLNALGRYYNTAELQIETNGPGQAVIGELKDYPNLGRHHDLATGKLSTKIGWTTTRSSKPYMIAQMSREIRNILTHDIDLLRQLRSCRWYGSDIIFTGEDDIAMSSMIAVSTYRGVGISDKGLVGTYGFKW